MALTTDATPRISPTPLQILQDEDKMKRLTASLSDGIFFYATEERATQIVEECFKICGGSPDTLSQIVQSDCFTGHTPLYWLIISHPHADVKVAPAPLFTKLLNVCGRLGLDAQKDIAFAFDVEYNSDLYNAAKAYLPDIPSHQAYSESSLFQTEAERPRLSASSFRKQRTPGIAVETTTVEFSIPFFFKRLLVDHDVSFEFPVAGMLWRLTTRLKEVSVISPSSSSNHAEWFFELSELRTVGKGSGNIWDLKIQIANSLDYGQRTSSTAWADALVVYDSNYPNFYPCFNVSAEPKAITVEADRNLLTLRRNRYTSDQNGTLRGKNASRQDVLLSQCGHSFDNLQDRSPHSGGNPAQNSVFMMQASWNRANTPGQAPVRDPAIAAMDVIQDKSRMNQLKAVFCDGIWTYADGDTAERIMQLSLGICGGSPDVLAEVLQKRFFVDHTPFYWVLLQHQHSPSSTRPIQKPEIPPLFQMLLIACDNMGLTKIAQEDIMEILAQKYDSEVYWLVKDKLTEEFAHDPWNGSYFHGEEDRPVVRVTQAAVGAKDCTVSFKIPKFFNRLTVDGEVWVQFMALGGLFRLRACFAEFEPDPDDGRSQLQFEVQDMFPWNNILPDTNRAGDLQLTLGDLRFWSPFLRETEGPTVLSMGQDAPTGCDISQPYWDVCFLSGQAGRDISGTLAIHTI